MKKSAPRHICNYARSHFYYICKVYLLFLQLTIAAHEAVNTTSGVNERTLTSIERVRGA